MSYVPAFIAVVNMLSIIRDAKGEDPFVTHDAAPYEARLGEIEAQAKLACGKDCTKLRAVSGNPGTGFDIIVDVHVDGRAKPLGFRYHVEVYRTTETFRLSWVSGIGPEPYSSRQLAERFKAWLAGPVFE